MQIRNVEMRQRKMTWFALMGMLLYPLQSDPCTSMLGYDQLQKFW